MENDKGEWSPANTAKQRTNAKPDKKLWNSSFDIALITFISIKLETLLTHFLAQLVCKRPAILDEIGRINKEAEKIQDEKCRLTARCIRV